MSDGRLGGALVLTVTLLAGSLVTRDARAEDAASMQQAAADLFRAGEAAYERQDYRAAALAFEEAHRRVPRAATLLNAGLAWQSAKEAPRAADDFAAALALGLTDGAAADDARSRLADVERECGVLELQSPAPARADIAHVQDAPLPAVVHLRPGTYTATVRFADGGRTTLVLDIERGKKSAVSALAPRSEHASPIPPASAGGGSTQKTLGWVGIAVGAALGITAGALGAATLSARSDLESSNDTDASARSRALRFRTLTNVAAVSAIVVGGTGIVLLVTAPSSSPASGAMAGFRAAF